MLQTPINQPTQQQQIDEGEAKKRQRGTGFTNINRILGANVGAGQRMGSAIGGQLGQQAEQVRKGIEQGQSQFEAGLKEGTSKEKQKIGAAEGAVSGIMQPTPTAPTVNYQDIGNVLRGAEYTGPTNIQDIQQQQQRAANLASLGRLSGLSGGQEQLLRTQVAGRGRYGLGQSALDAMLLGKEGQKQLEAARSQTGAVASQAGQSEAMAQSQAQAAQSAIEANKLATLQKIQKEYGGIDEKGAKQAKQFVSDVNELKKLFDPKNFTPKQLQEIQEGKNPEALKLLERAEAGEFGDIKGLMGQLYGGDKNALQNTLNSIVNAISPQIGGRYYKDQQQTQAQHLAELMSGAKAGEDVASRTYKTKLFDPSSAGLESILSSQRNAKDTAMDAAKQQDMAPVNRLLQNSKNPGSIDADWQTLNQLMPGSNNIIDAVFDRNAGKGDKDSLVKVAQAFEGTPLEKYAEQIENEAQFTMGRREFQNRFGGLIAQERANKINATDYSKDPRITSQGTNVFDALRQKLGLPVVKTAGDIIPPRTGPIQTPGNVYEDFYNNSIIKRV
jgi:hypothetical protein